MVFFNSLEDKILPFKEVDITIELEEDSNVIYRNANTNSDPVVVGDTRRYIVTKMVLWVPKMSFNSKGEEIYLESFMNKIKALRKENKKYEGSVLCFIQVKKEKEFLRLLHQLHAQDM